MHVLVMGLGYVGLPLAVQAVQAGHRVTGYDPSIDKTLRIERGSSPVEDIPDDQLQRALAGEYDGSLTVIHRKEHIGAADVVVICVPTPLTKGRPDLSYIEEAASTAAYRAVTTGTTVILESTTHPGTTRNVVVPILEKRSSSKEAGAEFHVGFSPERIDPGNPEYRFGNTTKLVSGLTDRCLDKVAEFYQGMGVPVHRMASLENAEMAKILENTFRHVNIALVNELTRVAGGLGVDMWDVIGGAATKPYGFMPFYPGPGVGGHCLPVDPVYLTEHVRTELGQTLHTVELAREVNDSQPDYIVHRVQQGLNERRKALKGSSVLVVGLAYKPNTSDIRESPAVEIVRGLTDSGARVEVLDPHVDTDLIERTGANAIVLEDLEAVCMYDAVVVVTPHASIDLAQVAKAAYVLDTRGVMPLGDNIERL